MMRVLRGFIVAIAFLAGLVGTSALLGRVAGPMIVPEFSGKLAHLAAYPDRYDVLFIGSSRVRRQIAPEVFDATLRERGLKLASYNFGLDGLGYPEALYVADRILELPLPRVKYVILELTRFPREFGPLLQADAQRTIYWHTPAYTWMMCHAAWQEIPALPERLAFIHAHLEIGLKRWLSIGRGPELWENRGGAVQAKVGPRGDGFFPVHQKFPAAQRAAYRQQVAALPQVLDAAPTIEPHSAAAAHALVEKFERQGKTVVILTMPRIHPTAPWVPDDGSRAVFRFDDPRQVAPLFDEALHYDAQHLNAEGAVVFTRQIAEKFAALLAGSTPAKAE